MIQTNAAVTTTTTTTTSTKSTINKNLNTESIVIKNLSDGEVITYSLVLIRGQAPSLCTKINIRTQHNHNLKSSSITEWPIIAGEFRILVDLARGINKLELETANGIKKQLTLIHEPKKSRLRVTPIYVICAGHDGYFQGPANEDCSPESAATRIGLGARLLQSLTAEKLQEAGHGRKTFQLERDLDGPECLVMHSMLNVDTARAMNQRELWEFVGREIMKGPLASKDRKYLAFLSCTKYRGAPSPRTHEATLASTQGHAALGGGGLALFGSACLHTWPTTLNQVLPKFLDTTIIDTDVLMDDSNYRGTYGGCLATTLGSVLHELAHTFDLGHTREGIMGRGFNYVDHVFIARGAANNHPAIGTDNNRNSRNKDPQRSTITLSKPLSVTVTINNNNINNSQSITSLANSKDQRQCVLSESYHQNSKTKTLETENENSVSQPASPDIDTPFHSNYNTYVFETSFLQPDKIFWGPSCATILAYHRWFATDNEHDLNNDHNSHYYRNNCQIEYNAKRNVIRSSYGIRVIELRDASTGMVINYRQFPGVRPPLEALVPPLSSPLAHTCYDAPLVIFAEDSVGNVLNITSSLHTPEF
ncbi:uncharacterized protein LOC103578937 [Microplitis demolitor]|uniref:uncharacterized protein LOC103578937 n=1 Tax=Microplitis demolitor TaxID=69319 RepID=UPI0004CC91E0|nr:uncharacterized protein LOC103578937 [Microplitis demolitor]XP_053593254.1 uncharacterized protein LOC103578937 [Microplitis demolitor]XP_053593255.1 uncharacterized protein LOC103578937 [Microplitis demolitor]XP_053593256.1 uncharacterized protein LOC103578937 [Microplitis demolitor]XP_053593257.1 uncharacterized protein LOC103578937 [Microplitis demolitor]